MKLDTEFVRLPLAFDADHLRAEVEAIEEEDWLPHPQGFRGNSALLLVSADGDPRNDTLKGHMRPTPVLERCPYLLQVLAALGSPIGRTRLMRIDEHEEATPHCDVHYYWRRHLRIHVPIVTDPSVRFVCGERELHMAQGECWIFDTWRIHNVLNPSSSRRIHLVADTTGSPALWDRIGRGLRPFAPAPGDASFAPEAMPWRPGVEPALRTEGASMPVVMSPVELAEHIAFLVAELKVSVEVPAALAAELETLLKALRARWHGLWVRFAASQEGWPHFRALLEQVALRVQRLKPELRLANGTTVAEAITQWVLRAAVNPELAERPHLVPFAGRTCEQAPRYEAPVFVVAAPRSGSSLLFETLSRSPEAWTVGGESHHVIEGLEPLTPAAHDWASNRLTGVDADEGTAHALQRRFAALLRDRDGRPWTPDTEAVRLLEKTPKNALRIPFLAQVFPQAHFVYLVREPRANVSSILEAWRSGEFVTYDKLPDWKGGRWSLLLIPGWRALEGKGLADVAVAQYRAAHETIMADLAALPRERWCAVSYEALVADPRGTVDRVSAFAGLGWDTPPPTMLPPSMVTVSAPAAGKWHRNRAVLEPHFQTLDAVAAEVAAYTGLEVPAPAPEPAPEPKSERKPGRKPRAAAPAAAAAAPAPKAEGDEAGPANPLNARAQAQARKLASVHTRSLVQVLQRAGISLAVSTYQAGKLVLVRADGEVVNTNFKQMRKPMGIAVAPGQMAIGTANEIQWFHDVPAMAAKTEPVGRVDACYLPRTIHFTGNIDIHEMAWAGEELWVVNTRFGCLCTIDAANSFTPRWKPAFLSALAPEDRCHLNGLAVVDGRVRYVTALGRTDSAGGWRENKASGGILVDVADGRIVAEGLSMPHSPRWYRDALWVLESGNGGLCRIDPASGRRETVAELPGFTRGLDFFGPLAFVGLSQVRESAVFAKLPLTERLTERICGVWVVNIDSGEVVAFLRFEEAVQEIFAVNVLVGTRFPELVLPGDAAIANAFVLPDAAVRQVPSARTASA